MTRSQRWILVAALVWAGVYVWLAGAFVGLGSTKAQTVARSASSAHSRPLQPGLQRAVFASGCFWCTEADFDKVKGVVATTSGYTGGRAPDPTYESVSSGTTDHVEAVEVMYDPSVVSYEELLRQYWRNVDPFVSHRQFCDVGAQYRPGIFVTDEVQRTAALASKTQVQNRFTDKAVVVGVSDATTFYAAEDYHQDYATKHRAQYLFYRYGCGRDRSLQAIWAGKGF
jgi:peptide-methionine (S)-S-oxide reductase